MMIEITKRVMDAALYTSAKMGILSRLTKYLKIRLGYPAGVIIVRHAEGPQVLDVECRNSRWRDIMAGKNWSVLDSAVAVMS